MINTPFGKNLDFTTIDYTGKVRREREGEPEEKEKEPIRPLLASETPDETRENP